ncbi:MAG: hypothetical protein U0559_06040 [Anaerolineae bacterium]
MIDLSDQLVGSLFLTSTLAWGLGLAIRIICNPSKIDKEVIKRDPNYLQITVTGSLRWLFGYMPVTGPVSMVGASFQLAAFWTIGMTALLNRIWSDVFHIQYWLPFVIFMVMISLARMFTAWLWTKQNKRKEADSRHRLEIDGKR